MNKFLQGLLIGAVLVLLAMHAQDIYTGLTQP